MKAKRIDITNGMLLGAMRRMKDREEITLEQYAESLRRAGGFFMEYALDIGKLYYYVFNLYGSPVGKGGRPLLIRPFLQQTRTAYASTVYFPDKRKWWAAVTVRTQQIVDELKPTLKLKTRSIIDLIEKGFGGR